MSEKAKKAFDAWLKTENSFIKMLSEIAWQAAIQAAWREV